LFSKGKNEGGLHALRAGTFWRQNERNFLGKNCALSKQKFERNLLYLSKLVTVANYV
jgi:rubredoxin